VQFVAFNNHLHFSRNKTWNIISDLFLWIFFGLSPHPNQDYTYTYFERFFDKNEKNNNISRRVLTSQYELSNWVNNNKFLLTMISISFVIVISFLLFSIYQYYKKCKNSDDKNLINTQDGSIYNLSKKYISKSYNGYLMKILMIAYCNVSSITIAQLLVIEHTEASMIFLELSVLLIFIIGFPIYIYYLLNKYGRNMYERNFLEKFGPIYLDFKIECRYFIHLIFFKQLIYSILINMSERLTLLQNSLIMITNILFLVLLFIIKPYSSKAKFKKAIILSLGMVAISIVNFIFISRFDESIKTYFSIVYYLIHGLVICSYSLITYIEYRKGKLEPTIESTPLNQNLNEIINKQSIDHVIDPDYKIDNRTRLSDSIINNI
tara:strand:+ start:670 stop:1803 length:1134 start_codon:yes stop_codon:yes gene_type:complete